MLSARCLHRAVKVAVCVVAAFAAVSVSSKAAAQCGGSGNCFQQHGTPGCSNVTCCNTVCAADPFCCTTNWDNTCVFEALQLCTTCGDSNAGSCYESHVGNGCNNFSCCDFVCEVDSFCCTTTWDSICVGEAIQLCSQCGTPGSGNCFAANGTLGCENDSCCQTVCFYDPYCCESVWDGYCADLAVTYCTSCGVPSAGSCLSTHAGAGCENQICCAAVCAIDPFCCTNNWDSFCVGSAQTLCATCGASASGICTLPSTTPACDDPTCCASVCAFDSYCCTNQWDAICMREALYTCYDIGHPESGDCYSPNSTVGCSSLWCSYEVCLADPFCCNFEWDSLCVARANEICCPQDCVGSFDFQPPSDGVVDGADLAILLGDWGRCKNCCSDTVTSATFLPPPDGVVDGADLALLLGAWGNPGCED